MSLEPNKEIVNRWTELAREFGKAYLARYLDESVTPYLHVFVYHVGFFLKNVCPIEMFANYDIESWHQINKRIKSRASSGFGGKKLGLKSTLPYQQMKYAARQTKTNNPTTIQTEERRENWAQRQISNNNNNLVNNPIYQETLNNIIYDEKVNEIDERLRFENQKMIDENEREDVRQCYLEFLEAALLLE